MKNTVLTIAAVIFALQGGFCATAVASDRDDRDKKTCEMYRERLKKYEKEGVTGINPMTGKVQKMDKKQAEEVIKDTKENIQVFCD